MKLLDLANIFAILIIALIEPIMLEKGGARMKPSLVNKAEIRKRLKEISDSLHTIKEYKSSNKKWSQQIQEKDKELNSTKKDLEKERDILENALKL